MEERITVTKSAYSGCMYLQAGDPLQLGSGANAETGRTINKHYDPGTENQWQTIGRD